MPIPFPLSKRESWWTRQGRDFLPIPAAGLVLTLLFALLQIFRPSFSNLIDLKLYDGFSRAAGGLTASDTSVIVAIDDRSLKEFGQWPWPRYRVARLLEKIQKNHPLSVGVDILFTEPDRTSPLHLQQDLERDYRVQIRFQGLPDDLLDNDRVLAETLATGPFVFGYSFFFENTAGTSAVAACRPHPLYPVIRTRPNHPALIDCLPKAEAAACVLPLLAEAATGSGFINAVSDPDGVVRRIPLLIRYRDNIHAGLPLATLMTALNPDKSAQPLVIHMGSTGVESLQIGRYIVPVDAGGQLMVKFYRRWNTAGYISAADLLNNRIPEERLNGRVVFVGILASGLKDSVTTPMEPLFPGVALHANIVDDILQSSYHWRPGWMPGLELMLIAGSGLFATLLIARAGASVILTACGILSLTWWAGAFQTFLKSGIYVSPLLPSGLLLSQLAILGLLKLRQTQNWVVFFRQSLARMLANTRFLKDAKERSDLASQSKSDFLARMSHEIRTPMNAILGMGELLSGTALTEEQKDYLQTLQNSGELLLSLINDILDLSKIEAGLLSLESIPLNIRELVEGVIHILSHKAHQSGLELTCRIAPEVPPFLSGDPTRIRQILMNLIGNAIKFTPQGSIRITVSSPSGKQSTGCFQFEVRDTGIGIPAEKQKLIFENFAQAETSTNRQYGGTGLGLAISKRLIEAMGGEIRVESTPGLGSCFIFTLRLPEVSEIPEIPRALAQPQPRDLQTGIVMTPILPPVRILLVDDVAVNRRIIEAYLKKTAVHIDIAENGREAIEKYQNGGTDLILMDMEMPVMDGFEATRSIRKLENDSKAAPIPIVALTAHAFSTERQRCLDAGCSHFFTKPIRKADLFKLMLELFGSAADSDSAPRETVQQPD
ncbi:MAG: CHASE2 domain-containing protein [Deltaproteobacteria bacterium]|nr:CHASE2 domain-containing protein [Deltaproteobacteria bacterium]